MFKHLLDTFEITILNIERYRVHTEWRHSKVSSPYSRLYLITQGSGHIYYHKLEKKIALQPGCMYLIPCHTLVDLYCPKSFDHFYIHFTARTRLGLDLLSLLDLHLALHAQKDVVDLFIKLSMLNPGKALIERDANKPIYGDILKRAIDLDRNTAPDLLLQSNAAMRCLIASFIKPRQPATVHDAIRGHDRFDEIINFMHKNIEAKLNVPQIARIAGLHPTYFSNLFTSLLGVSPVKYLNRLRIEKAQSLLLSSNGTLDDIARQVGFEDVFYFSRVFKAMVGIAPAKYRRQL